MLLLQNLRPAGARPGGLCGRLLGAWRGHAPPQNPQHRRVCPFLNYIHPHVRSALIVDLTQQEDVSRFSHLHVLGNQRLSGKGSVCRLICVSGRRTALVTYILVPGVSLGHLSWPEASRQDCVHTVGVWRGQGPSPGSASWTSLFPGWRDEPPAPRTAVRVPVWRVVCKELWLSPGRGREVGHSLGVLVGQPQKPAASPHLGDSFKVHFRIRTLDVNVIQPRRPSAPLRVGVHTTRDHA